MQDVSHNYDKCYDIYLIGIDGNKNIKQEQYFCLEVLLSSCFRIIQRITEK